MIEATSVIPVFYSNLSGMGSQLQRLSKWHHKVSDWSLRLIKYNDYHVLQENVKHQNK